MRISLPEYFPRALFTRGEKSVSLGYKEFEVCTFALQSACDHPKED